jgi:hypothetical protein
VRDRDGCAANTAGSPSSNSAAATAADGGRTRRGGSCSTDEGAHNALPLPGTVIATPRPVAG